MKWVSSGQWWLAQWREWRVQWMLFVGIHCIMKRVAPSPLSTGSGYRNGLRHRELYRLDKNDKCFHVLSTPAVSVSITGLRTVHAWDGPRLILPCIRMLVWVQEVVVITSLSCISSDCTTLTPRSDWSISIILGSDWSYYPYLVSQSKWLHYTHSSLSTRLGSRPQSGHESSESSGGQEKSVIKPALN